MEKLKPEEIKKRFENTNTSKYYDLVEYDDSKNMIIKCKNCGTLRKTTIDKTIRYKLICEECKYNIDRTKKHVNYIERLKNLEENTLFPIEQYKNIDTSINHECNKCGNIFRKIPKHILQKNIKGCPYCNDNMNNVVIKGINDMWTTNPEISQLLSNKEEGYKYSKGSNTKLKFECPSCGNIKEYTPHDLLSRNFSCNRCGDNISMPEKFMSNFLSMNNISYKHDNITEWSDNKRYDFIINDDIIIETHGIQHYHKQKNRKFKIPLEKQQEIDKYYINK
jgi:predicted  nucleic acid-binding Zn-ribbon protein